MKTFVCALLMLPSLSMPVLAGMRVHVVFQNGDRVSGELLSADANAVQFQPSAAAFGGPIIARWTEDMIAELQLNAAPNGAPACLYTSPGSSNEAGGDGRRGELCFRSASVNIMSNGGAASLRITKLRDKSGAAAPIDSPSGDSLNVASILITRPSKTDLPSGQVSDGPIESGQVQPAGGPAGTANNAATPVLSMWSVGLSAPESIVQGTQSSQTLGGLFSDDLYFGDADHFSLTASGTHQHNLSLHKPSIRTDTFDATGIVSHAIHAFKIYAVGDWFLNTSLGMAAQSSGGAGVLFPTYRPSKSTNFTLELWADLRYFNERLYSAKELDLIGSRIHTQAHYLSSNATWSLTAEANYVPMFNDMSAWQAYGRVMLSVPISTHVCLDLTPADDYYFDNSPRGFRRNYLKSSATLRIQSGSNAADKCR